jgi:hypothetical protein
MLKCFHLFSLVVVCNDDFWGSFSTSQSMHHHRRRRRHHHHHCYHTAFQLRCSLASSPCLRKYYPRTRSIPLQTSNLSPHQSNILHPLSPPHMVSAATSLCAAPQLFHHPPLYRQRHPTPTWQSHHPTPTCPPSSVFPTLTLLLMLWIPSNAIHHLNPLLLMATRATAAHSPMKLPMTEIWRQILLPPPTPPLRETLSILSTCSCAHQAPALSLLQAAAAVRHSRTGCCCPPGPACGRV